MQIQNGFQISQLASQESKVSSVQQHQGVLTEPTLVQPNLVSDDQVSLSAKSTNASSAQAYAVAMYEDMTRVYTEKLSLQQQEDTVDQPKGISDLPPITFFTADDVANYEERLSNALAKAGVDTSQEIDLGIDYEGKVYVKNDHPDKDKIEQLFKEDSELQQGLVKTQNFFLFKELYRLTQEWAQKVDSGMSEEMAGEWLLRSSKQSQQVSSAGLTFKEGGMVDPFDRSSANSVALSAYTG